MCSSDLHARVLEQVKGVRLGGRPRRLQLLLEPRGAGARGAGQLTDEAVAGPEGAVVVGHEDEAVDGVPNGGPARRTLDDHELARSGSGEQQQAIARHRRVTQRREGRVEVVGLVEHAPEQEHRGLNPRLHVSLATIRGRILKVGRFF